MKGLTGRGHCRIKNKKNSFRNPAKYINYHIPFKYKVIYKVSQKWAMSS